MGRTLSSICLEGAKVHRLSRRVRKCIIIFKLTRTPIPLIITVDFLGGGGEGRKLNVSKKLRDLSSSRTVELKSGSLAVRVNTTSLVDKQVSTNTGPRSAA